MQYVIRLKTKLPVEIGKCKLHTLQFCLIIQCVFFILICDLIEHVSLFQFNLIPKARLSLKVLAELPIIVVLMYQLYKAHVHQEVAEFIPLIMNTIILTPSPAQRYGQHFTYRDMPIKGAPPNNKGAAYGFRTHYTLHSDQNRLNYLNN